MIIGFIKKLFGAEPAPTAGGSSVSDEPDLERFVKFVVSSLVDSPDRVSIETVAGEKQATIQVSCDKRDVGKVIGKNGKTISAIRALTNGAAGRMGKKVNVEILD